MLRLRRLLGVETESTPTMWRSPSANVAGGKGFLLASCALEACCVVPQPKETGIKELTYTWQKFRKPVLISTPGQGCSMQF